MQVIDLKRKICLVGDAAVGKTSLIRKYVYDKFDDKYIATVGTKVTKKEMVIKDEEGDRQVYLTIMIWDVIGQKALKRIHEMYFKGAKGALVVCDLTRKETLDSVRSWIESLYNVADKIPVVILGNKYDLVDQAQFSEDDLIGMAKEFESQHFMTSAKSGINVENAFQAIGELISKP